MTLEAAALLTGNLLLVVSLAVIGGCNVQHLAAGVAAVIRIDAIWLAVEPLDMRAGTDTVLAKVVKVFGAARPHHAYLFANKNATRMKVLGWTAKDALPVAGAHLPFPGIGQVRAEGQGRYSWVPVDYAPTQR